MKIEDYEQYWQKGGTYNLPIEILNELFDEIENWKEEAQQLKEEIEELELIVGLRQKRNLISKFDKEYDAEDKKKNPNRTYAGTYPDAEEVYKRYYAQKEIIDKAIEYINSKEYQYGDLEQDVYDYDIGFDEVEELLEILKGEENE